MARVHQAGPQTLLPTARPFPSVPDLRPIFNDTFEYANTVLRPIPDASWLASQHSDRGLRDRLSHDFKNIRDRLDNIKLELRQLIGANYQGLSSVFENPQCDALEELRKLAKEIAIAANALSRIFEFDLRDPTGHTLSQAFETRAIGLDHRISQALTSWRAFPSTQRVFHLCRTALQLLAGEDDGTINYIDTKSLDSSEKHLLERRGGSFQFWKCQACKFETKFYVRKARSATLELTEHTLDDFDLRYRSVLLAKSHLQSGPRQPMTYGCILCFAQGRKLVAKESGFKSEKGLLQHIAICHNVRELPSVFMEKLYFTAASPNQQARRYDLKFLKG